jgi:hypothetical protein
MITTFTIKRFSHFGQIMETGHGLQCRALSTEALAHCWILASQKNMGPLQGAGADDFHTRLMLGTQLVEGAALAHLVLVESVISFLLHQHKP